MGDGGGGEVVGGGIRRPTKTLSDKTGLTYGNFFFTEFQQKLKKMKMIELKK